ncbi:MAG TPA: hypothetical protein VFW63_07340, partial [Acidimicrobiales bacterium]|nr:hypothetical protein [Acidimicrobiales bacterium]
MPVDTTLPEEVALLEAHAGAVARDVLGPGADAAERARGWGEAAGRAFAELGTRGLWLPADCGGDDNPLAAVVAVDALAAGDVGGLVGADRPGPAAGVLRVMPDRRRAAALAGAVLAGGATRADRQGSASPAAAPPGDGVLLPVALADALGDVAPGFGVPWAPGGGVPVALLVAAADGVAVVPGGALAAEPAEASALWAAGGVALRVTDGAPVDRYPLAPDAALAARAVPRLWAAAALCGVGRAALDHAVAYGRERVVFGLP